MDSLAMLLGPVSNATTNFGDDLPRLLFAEAVAIPVLYLSMFGFIGTNREKAKPLGGTTRVLLFGVGAFFLWAALSGLSRTEHWTLGMVILVSAFVGLVSWRSIDNSRYKGWQQWPQTTATIEDVDVREISTKSSHYFLADTAYSYKVRDEYYSGRFDTEFADETSASDFAEKTRGSTITVRYDPKLIERSMVVQ